MSLEQKIPDGVIVIPRTHPLSWIMMFYALPKEMFENLPEYRQLPRNMRDIQVSEKYMRMINCDDFLIMIWSLYAWMVWHCLRVPGKNGEYRPIPGAWGHYSEDFPIWRMTYEIGMHFRELFERCSNWKVQRLFDLKKDEEMPWLSLPDFCTIVKSMTQFVIDNMNLQPLIDEVWYHRAEEGVAARAMEKKGIISDRCELNRQIKADNALLRELKDLVAMLTELVADAATSITDQLTKLREKLIVICYQIKVIIRSRDKRTATIQATQPKMKRYNEVTQQIRQKAKTRKVLVAEQKNTSKLNLIKQHDLSRQITTLTEEIEELRSEKENLSL